MSHNTQTYKFLHRWGLIIATTIFALATAVSLSHTISLAAPQAVHTWGFHVPCTPGGNDTCNPNNSNASVGSIPTVLTFTWSDPTGLILQTDNPEYHGISRTTGMGAPGPQFDGGQDPATATVKWGVNITDRIANPNQATTLTIDFSNYFTGFTLDIYDVDSNPSAFQDRIVAIPQRDGTFVTPTISTPSDPDNDAHIINGNVITGDKTVDNADTPGAAEATVRIEVNDVANRIAIRYEAGDGGPVDPNPQAIAIGAPMTFTPVGPNAVNLTSTAGSRWYALVECSLNRRSPLHYYLPYLVHTLSFQEAHRPLTSDSQQ